MKDDAYIKLAQALDRLPCGFPGTKSGVELTILKKIFSPEEALIASHLTGTSEPVEIIAARMNLPEKVVVVKLREMLNKGIIWGSKKDSIERFRLSPLMVGFYEEQVFSMDHELAHLFEQYFDEGGLEGIMRPLPSIFRIIPSQRALKTELILPYDDIKSLLSQAKHFAVRDCICRKQKMLVNSKKCDFPLHNCLTFTTGERQPAGSPISYEEALKILDNAEEIGLVHTVNNVIKGIYFLCNCCGCCCSVLRGINQFGIENSVAKANYYAVVNPELCTGCGICEQRCQIKACSVNDVAEVNRAKCIGCGLCVTGCPSEAVSLKLRPDAELIKPPDDYKTWEHLRLRNRGLAE